MVKARLRKSDCSTKQKLIEAVIQVRYHDDELNKISPKLVKSMPDRVKLVLKARGGHIDYYSVIFSH